MNGAAILIPIIALMIPLVAVISKSDIGQAIADAIRHNSGATEGAAARRELETMKGELDQLRAEMEDVHTQLLEAHERLDFAERLLARPADANPVRPSVNA
jgi:multidrug resistance efflux pump